MEVIALVESGGTDSYTFDIETATTIAIDKEAEQSNKLKFIEAISGFSTSMMQSVQANMMPYSAYVAMLKMAASTFSGGRSLKDEFEVMVKNNDQMQQLQQQLTQVQQESQQQILELQQQNQGMQFELSRRNNIDMAKTQSETRLKDAQTYKVNVEASKAANEQVVPQFAAQDELMAAQGLQQTPINTQFNPQQQF